MAPLPRDDFTKLCLGGRKGLIAPGADADVVLYDPNQAHTLGADTHHMAADNSVWDAMTVTGRAESVMSRGHWVIRDRTFVGRPGNGQYLERSLPEPLQ